MSNVVQSIDYVAAACAIYRVNNNRMVKGSSTKYSSNAQLVQHFRGIALVEVTEADKQSAETICTYLEQQVMLSKLTNKRFSEFVEGICITINRPTINFINESIAVWAPSAYASLLAKDNESSEFARVAITSKYLGKVSAKIETNFVTVSKRWHREFRCFRYQGHDGAGNAVGFLSIDKFPASIRISGNIKKVCVSAHTGCKVTILTYVKVAK